ncbi:hypothetical protein [Propionivibrio dicarboxylicus]|uniref:Uncharacterized protein n=1 Tax=Propionivibrio dicarboxylicus TaxID=83767 RepID=A0A1G7ZRR6_9RHOO|nr:hypothetical protein [Propionivibrio dicarboxylicus]SDH11373.1 hypothetical protein SAMN05660652_01260 [Propionivibrio dicarboxylicus]
MERLLINMAIVKVNWDRSGADLLENHIPLLAYALSECTATTASLSEIRTHFRQVAEFEVPTAALGTLVKRAAKRHGFLTRDHDGTYQICRDKLPDRQYLSLRDTELRKYQALKQAFVEFCEYHHIAPPTPGEIDAYFFDVLYDVAPSLIGSTAGLPDNPGGAAREPESTRALIARFVAHCYERDPISSASIESFVRGAMLTETFYYSAPDTLSQKMRDVVVVFDTGFLVRSLGLCEAGLAEPCKELAQILRGMSVKMRCFRDTFNELHRILHAASSQLRGGRRLVTRVPGDIFDYYNSIGASQSDVELDIAMLEQSLNKIGIRIEDRPPHIASLTVNETLLGQYIQDALPGQTLEARQHDIDCLTSIYRLRSGRAQQYLESCIAIFVTTNVELARASARYFNMHEEISNAPICMADQVFTTLVWLKSVNKIPDLPKHRLVANCIAAMQPSDRLWNRYLAEATTLKERKEISENDYAVLIHSLEARHHLMDSIIEQGEFVHGSVKEVLELARANYTEEINEKLTTLEIETKAHRDQINRLIATIARAIALVTCGGALVIWITLIVAGLFVTAPESFSIDMLSDPKTWLFLVVALVGTANLMWGVKLYDLCEEIATQCSGKAALALSHLLLPKRHTQPSASQQVTTENVLPTENIHPDQPQEEIR